MTPRGSDCTTPGQVMEERKGRRLGAGQGGSCRGGGGDMWRLLGDILQKAE